MQFINTIDTILSFVDTVRRYANLRDILSSLCWLIGRVVDILTSRRAIRLYVSIWQAFIFTCQCAIESGRIVASGYYAVDHVESADVVIEVSESDEIALLPDGSWGIAGLLPPAPEPEPRVLITPPPGSFPQMSIDSVNEVIPVFLDRKGNPLKGRAYQQRLKKVLALA